MMLEGEQLDDLWRGGLQILQKKDGFKYGIDSVLLAHFVPCRKHQTVLDIGTGSGIIPILLNGLEPSLSITGIDIQSDYVDMAKRSVEHNQQANITILEGDARHLDQIFGRDSFDVVVTNPPYYNKALVAQRPDKAIARSEIHLTLAELIEQASFVLKPKGQFCLIYHPGRLGELMSLLHQHRLEVKQLRFIHPGEGREANLVLVRASKGGGREVRILPPLFVYRDGAYTEELLRIYDEIRIEKERA